MNLETSKSVTYKQEKVEVEYANGSKMNHCSVLTAKINIEDYYHSDDFIVATIDKHDVILGREWLRRVNPYIDWRLGTVTFEFQGRQHCWQSLGKKEKEPSKTMNSPSLLSHLQIKRMACKKEAQLFLAIVRQEESTSILEKKKLKHEKDIQNLLIQ
jgi:hypothetical protein